MRDSLSWLEQGGQRLVMIGGKGGVGKTTCAAAIALRFAEKGKKTLVISSDPTPSLSDIFETPVGDRETPIKGVEDLHAMEISSQLVLKLWRQRFGKEIHEVIRSFADVDYDFVDYVGTAPGIEEEYMLSYILDLVQEGKYERVVWDTAPAGHTLKLLQLPHLFLKHLEAATKFYLNLYGHWERIKDGVRLQRGKRSILDIIGSWEQLAGRIVEFIQDPTETAFLLVTIPEALGVRQSERIIQELEENRVAVRHLIVNHTIQNADCEFHAVRRQMQQQYQGELGEKFGQRIPLLCVPEKPVEVKGLARIGEMAEVLFTEIETPDAKLGERTVALPGGGPGRA